MNNPALSQNKAGLLTNKGRLLADSLRVLGGLLRAGNHNCFDIVDYDVFFDGFLKIFPRIRS